MDSIVNDHIYSFSDKLGMNITEVIVSMSNKNLDERLSLANRLFEMKHIKNSIYETVENTRIDDDFLIRR